MKNDYIPIVFAGLIGFSVAGYVASTLLLPKKPLKDKFLPIFAVSSVGLMIGSLTGYAMANNLRGGD